MKNISLRYDTSSVPSTGGRFDRISLILGVLAAAVAIASAVAIGQFGALVLLAIPALILISIVFLRPEFGLSIFIFITVTQISNVAIQFFGMPSIAQPLAGLLMAVIIFRMVMYRERPLVWGRVVPILAIYVFVLFISMLRADDFTLGSKAFIGFAKDALGGVIVILLIQRPSTLREAIWALILAGIFMGTISVIQAITKTYDYPYFGFGGWELQSAGEGTRYRLTGPYGNPNAFSQVMVVMFILALERLWHEKHSVLRTLSAWAVIVCGLAIVFTYSRGGVLTLLAAVAFLFFQNRPRFLPIFLTVAIALSLIQFLPADYTNYLGTLQDIIPTQGNNQINDPSFRGRLSENIAAWRMFNDNPIFGVGLGNFETKYQDYSRQLGLDSRSVPRSPASLYLEVLSEQGLIGVLSFLLLIYTVLHGLRSARVQFAVVNMNDQSNFAMSLFAGFLGYLIAAIVKNSAYSNVYWVLVGLAISTAQVALFSVRKKNELSGFYSIR